MPSTRAARRWWPVAAGTLVAAATVTTATVVSRANRTREATIPAGTQIVGALNRTVSTKSDPIGESVQIRTAAPLKLNQETTLPAGLVLRGQVIQAKGGGRISGAPELTIKFTEIVSNGRTYPIVAQPFHVRGKSDTKESVAEIAGGAVAGGIVGKIAGSTLKGAVIGP
jgi:hypothetical protein